MWATSLVIGWLIARSHVLFVFRAFLSAVFVIAGFNIFSFTSVGAGHGSAAAARGFCRWTATCFWGSRGSAAAARGFRSFTMAVAWTRFRSSRLHFNFFFGGSGCLCFRGSQSDYHKCRKGKKHFFHDFNFLMSQIYGKNVAWNGDSTQ